MGNPAATLERENLSAMNVQSPQLEEPERPRAAIKFTYPSGARPLDGYTIKRGVGRGGFGEVYFATSDAGKEVALKLIRRNLDVELRGVTQCLNLKHPNLIALYDIRTDEMGDQWVVMEYVSGESLEEVIERSPNGMPIEQVLQWMRGLCAGVAYLHDHGIVHRDLKPGNIFSDDGTVKIGDYGLAKFISCSRRSGQTESVGTVHYMAPEIANGRYGREIDTYALGIILFEMLTGHVPFEGESVGEVLMKHLTAEPDLSALQEPYRDIVQRALAKDPNVRLKSVGELVALLPGGGDAPAPVAAAAQSPQPQISPQAAQHGTIRDANEMAREGWTHAKRLIRVAKTSHPGSEKPEEPIWKAIRQGMYFTRRRWYGDGVQPMPIAHKVSLVLILVFAATMLHKPVASIALQFLVIYAIYYALWMTLIRPGALRHAGDAAARAVTSAPAPTADRTANLQTAVWAPTQEPSQVATQRADQAQRRRRARTNWRETVHAQLAAKPFREKLTELLGSMLLAAIFASIAACAVPLLLHKQTPSEQGATYLWLAMVGTLGSWAILVPAKFTEGRLEDQVPMRMTLMLLGVVVGVAAWYIGDTVMLAKPGWGEPIDVGHGLVSHEMLGWQQGYTNPAVQLYIAYFAFLFVLPRWWRQTEYTRATRMSLWSVIVCVFWAWLLHIFWWFPQPIGMMAAGVIALATQLASPWMPPSKRRSIGQTMEQV